MRKYYFINKLDTNTIDKQDKKTNIIYREGNSVKANEKEIIKIKKFCKKTNQFLFIKRCEISD